jgi:hypothetical protein
MRRLVPLTILVAFVESFVGHAPVGGVVTSA